MLPALIHIRSIRNFLSSVVTGNYITQSIPSLPASSYYFVAITEETVDLTVIPNVLLLSGSTETKQ